MNRQQRPPSVRFLYSAATHAFLQRQHPRCLLLLTTLLAQLPQPAASWTATDGALTPKDEAREDVRRQAIVLWLTAVVCLALASRGEKAQREVHAGSSSDPSTAAPHGLASTGDVQTDAALRLGEPEALLRALIDRAGQAYASPPPHPRRSSRSSAASLSGTSPPAQRPSAHTHLPPQVTQTLLLAARQLNVPPPATAALVLAPFLAGIPLALQHRLAGRSRTRESALEFDAVLEDTQKDVWLDKALDAYEGVVETWCLSVLGAEEASLGKAREFVRQDMVLGRARKTALIDTLTRMATPPATHAFAHRPPSPGLSETSSSSSSGTSVLTATPDNPLPLPPADKASAADAHGRAAAAGGSYARHVAAIQRFITPRPTRRTSSSDAPSPLPSVPPTDASSASLQTITVHPSTPPPRARALALVRRCVPRLRLPVLLAFVLSLVVGWVRRRAKEAGRRAAAGGGGGVGDEVRRRLVGGVLGGW